jgi:hypothetical protein
MGPHLAALQPQMVPLFAAQLPAAAAKAALAKHAAAAAAGGDIRTRAATGGVCVLLPGVVAKLPGDVASLAVDLLYYVGELIMIMTHEGSSNAWQHSTRAAAAWQCNTHS